MCRALLGFFCLSVVGGLLPAADWNQFRGPEQNGHSKANLPVEWSPTKNVAWKVPVPGKGWSSPVVQNGLIYLTTAVPRGDGPKADQSLRVLALDGTNGGTIWDREVRMQIGSKAPNIHSKNSHASPTAVIDGDTVYAHFGHMGTYALSAMDGSILWKNELLGYVPVHGNGGSPMLVEGRLIFSIDGTDRQEVVALNSKTGQIVWRTPRNAIPDKAFSFNTPLLIDAAGRKQLISVGSDVVMSINPADGSELWRVRFKGYSVVPRPVYAEGLLFVTTCYDKSTLIAIRPDGKGDVTTSHVAWKVEKNVPNNPGVVVVDGLLYMVSDTGIASCLDARTGSAIWSERVTDKYTSAILHAPGRVYLQSEDGTGTVLKTGRTFETIAINKLGERTLASYAVIGSDLLIRTDKHLYRIGNGGK